MSIDGAVFLTQPVASPQPPSLSHSESRVPTMGPASSELPYLYAIVTKNSEVA